LDYKTINKVWNGLIPCFEVALCSKLSDYPNYIDGSVEYEISCKCDGGRSVAIKRNGKVTLISRQGKVWEGLKEVENAIENLSEDNIVLDGELTVYDFLNYPSDEVYKATMKIVSSKDENKVGIQFNAFDILTYDEWCNGCKTIQKDRRIHLDKLLSENKSKALFNLPALYIGKDPSKIGELMKTLVEPNNWEGLVIKDCSKIYEHKRCKSWLKVKQMETYDLRIIDVFEGENALVGKLGGFIAEVTLPDGKFVHTKIGSGFSLVDRSDLWLIKDSLIGKAIEVQGFELTTNDKSDFYSIRFPVFKGFIEEGKELNGDYKGI
jgi:DNA ligase-1